MIKRILVFFFKFVAGEEGGVWRGSTEIIESSEQTRQVVSE